MSEFVNEMDKEPLPSGINVLTILTFVGSGFGILGGIWNYIKSADNLAKMEETMSKPEFQNAPDFVKKMYSPEMIDLLRKTDANKLPLTVIAVVSCLLCVYGAIEMRKLKKSGFYTYTIGELLPIAGSLLFLGGAYLSSGWSAYLGIGVSLLFVVLYSLQLKYLTEK